jgi:valyl-tRNA synthetase
MTDENVDMEFGSGILMVCTFGDTADIEKWKEHKLPMRICITEDGKLNELGGKYKGLDLVTAKKAIKKDLAKEGYIIKEENLEQEVGMCWRCKTPIEYMVAKQWFVRTLKYKKDIIAQSKKINWYPSFYRKRLEDWTNNLGWDWCISRQRLYGVPIPVWYCKKCEETIFAEEKDLPVDPLFFKPKKKCKCGSSDFVPEEDIFDTWMTSSMTPQIASQQLKNPNLYKKIFPMSLRPQSHDIIRTWAFYTILKSYLLYKEIPWKDVMIGTYVLDSKGRGMHKSAGNVIWLPDMLKKYSVDALRYWAASAGVGEDLPFQEKEMIRGTKLLVKLWNSARFAFIHIKDAKEAKNLEIEDKWILSRLSETVKTYKDYMEKYRISRARKELEMFFLHDFCDFYLEMIKHRLYGEDKESNNAAKWTLYKTFLGIIKLWAPIIPHITEEIYQELFSGKEGNESVHLSSLPEVEEVDKEALEAGSLAKDVISLVRQYKTQKDLAMNAELGKVVIESDEQVGKNLKKTGEVIKGTMKIKKIEYKKGRDLKVEVE